MTPLAALTSGQAGRVVEIRADRAGRRRLGGMGVHPGDLVEVLANAVFGGPVLIRVHDAEVALGRDQALLVVVEVSP